MIMNIVARTVLGAAIAAIILSATPPALADEQPASPFVRPDAPAGSNAQVGKIAPYRARFGRPRPVIAIVGENSGTELTDYVIPYGVLTQSGVAETITLATQPGAMTMRPTLRIQPQATVAEFDARFPEGADYVIVPAVVKRDDPVLLAWIAAQGAKGSTIVSICDGALVVANSGLLKGHRATAHWATQGLRAKEYPDTQWLSNIRYVADGAIVSSAGISASIPTSIALVEAIAGTDRAAALANELGVADWSTTHDSDRFRPRFGVNLMAYARTAYTNARLHALQSVGVPVAPGVDEIALALTADAYSRTGRSHAYALSATDAPLQTRHGLTVLPDRVIGGPNPVDRTLPAFDATPSARMLDQALAGIAESFGRSTAYGVASDFEYPDFKK
jgi:putative intracellular protease/amidase